MIEIADQGLIVRMVIERAREVDVHEAGVEAERDLGTKEGSIDHEVEIDQEGLAAKRGDHAAERDQEMTAKKLWMLKMRTELAMKNDR